MQNLIALGLPILALAQLLKYKFDELKEILNNC